MVSKLDSNDFRAHRKILEPSDFALGSNDPDPPPTDMIPEEAWNGIMTLPDDVAIRTTGYQGSRVSLLYDLWTGWVGVLSHQGILADAMLDSADDLAAAQFNLIHGFYRQSIASLRNALETMVFACECELGAGFNDWNAWQQGHEWKFTETFEKLRTHPKFGALENRARQETGASIFPFGQNDKGYAWARNLYQRLGKFSHARGDSTNGYLWESNGPIYSAEGMRLAYHAYIETYALLILIAKVASEQVKMPIEARVIFKPDSLSQYLEPQFQALCTFYRSELFA